ncbi:hypothetical protein [Paraburkholderia sediminicola]|uniref:hypothetical protein n=1 Tax=Paraburkholderia sediminicola TaxID=458836 RepID=UPI0038BA7CDB
MATLIDTSIYHDDLLTADAEERPEPLTEAQRAAQFDDVYWDRLDANSRDLATAVRRYARPNCHVSLFDEHRGI